MSMCTAEKANDGVIVFDDYTRYREVHDAVTRLGTGGLYK
jgi:hypothetical protein